MIYFQSLTRNELVELIKPLSRIKRKAGISEIEYENQIARQANYRARQIFHWVYQRFQTDWDQMTDLSKELRSWLKENVEIYRLKERQSRQAVDGTYKFLWELHDHKTIESVIIPAALNAENNGSPIIGQFVGKQVSEKIDSTEWSRLTACISSQVGCAMACKFCLTGVQGLDRHLEVYEIVTQIFELRKVAPITNIVFMGMGEPLHNFENVVKACEILLDQDGFNFSKRKITISTSGLVSAIEELGKRIDVSLAISLNGTTDEQRSLVMPVNKKWNIKQLLEACKNYPLGSHRRITFEYVMLAGINDSLDDAERLFRLTKDIPSKVNLIPFNEHSGSIFKRPSDEVVRTFQKYLLNKKITATVRVSRGQDILAACGQLRSIFGSARGTERHKDWQDLQVIS